MTRILDLIQKVLRGEASPKGGRTVGLVECDVVDDRTVSSRGPRRPA